MQRYRQTLDELRGSLSPIEVSWRDEHADEVIETIRLIPDQEHYGIDVVESMLDSNFGAGLTAARLLSDRSKDEFTAGMKGSLGKGGVGVKRYRSDKAAFLEALEQLGVLDALIEMSHKPISWRDVLLERLKAGRGSAIKAQARGRRLEDITESSVKAVFGEEGYDVRCRFLGADGTSREKADFAIPSKDDPRVLIETKGYGATGSKQTDILGDVTRIISEKRNDTDFLLVTDGISWLERLSDLKKLIMIQNTGKIGRIYTVKMQEELVSDLKQLKQDHTL